MELDLSIKEKIGAARGSLKIPIKNIVSAFSEAPSHPSGMKTIGTNIPGMIELGTYLAGRQKEFWYTKKGSAIIWFWYSNQIFILESSLKLKTA